MSEETASAADAAEASVAQRMYGVFFSPKATFADIARRPDWVFPFVIGIVTSVLSGYFLQDVIWEVTREQMQNNPNISPEQLEQTLQAAETWVRYSSWIMPLITTVLMYVVIAALLLFSGNVLLGGEARFVQVFSVVCWSSLVNVVNSLVNVPLMRSRGELASATNLTFLAPEAEMQSVTYFLLSQLDLFYLWWVALLGMGLAAVYNYTTQKGITIVASWWVLYIIIASVFKLIF